MSQTNVSGLLNDAQSDGMGNKATSILVENLNALTVAGAQGLAVDDLSGDHVVLLCVILDETGSMDSYRADVVDAYNNMLSALRDSKTADDILISTWFFNTQSKLLHGYTDLAHAPSLGRGNYAPDGGTALFDAVLDGLTGVVAYGQDLRNNGISTKVIVVVLTDGEDNSSRHRATDVQIVVEDLLHQEFYTLALVAFGSGFAQQVATQMGFPAQNILESGADARSIRRALGTVSKSIIRASQTVIDPNASGFFS
jgi:hypothetical protein